MAERRTTIEILAEQNFDTLQMMPLPAGRILLGDGTIIRLQIIDKIGLTAAITCGKDNKDLFIHTNDEGIYLAGLNPNDIPR